MKIKISRGIGQLTLFAGTTLAILAILLYKSPEPKSAGGPYLDDNVTIGDRLYTCHGGVISLQKINPAYPIHWPKTRAMTGRIRYDAGNVQDYMITCDGTGLESTPP